MAKDYSIGFGELHTQMKITNKLLAAQLKDKLQQKELIRLLMTTGANDQEIADVVGTTPGTVSVTKARLKRDVEGKNASKPTLATSGADQNG